jgi:3-deoxy-D-manno-octulosonate 8-phosphate phosphatase (KDO 8-P phosphatase)
LKKKARRIRLLLLDVDGVLTDGRLYYDDRGREWKAFHVQDGLGIRWLLEAGIQVGLLSGRTSKAVEKRAAELKVSFWAQGVAAKDRWLLETLPVLGLTAEEVAFVGDDFPDLPLFGRVGLSVTVKDGHPYLQKRADYVTRARGGDKAVREVAELLLKAQGKWTALTARYRK